LNNLNELRELLRETRIQKGLSYKQLKEKTKIPVDIIQKIEEDIQFLEKNIYARMFLKQLLKELGINAEIKTINTENSKEKEENKSSVSENAGKLVNASLGLTALSGLIFISLAFKPEDKSNNIQAYKIILQSKPVEEKNIINIPQQKEDSVVEEAKSIKLIATSNVWITANIDGEMEIINLKAGDKVDVSFLKKVVFETIGNANALKMEFNNKQIVIRKEIVHNIFVDAHGVFLNGYNLAKES